MSPDTPFISVPDVRNNLDLPEIFALIEDHCASSPGKAALPRAPLADAEAAADEHDRIYSCRQARTQVGGFHFGCEVTPELLTRCAIPEIVLAAEDLVLFWDAARSAADAKEQTDADRSNWERFGAEVDGLPDLSVFRAKCRKTFDRRGGVLDDATPRLAEIRRRQRQIQAHIETELNRVVKADKQYLSEGFVTQRDGRWVVPLQANFRGRVPGMVVSSSKTGATLYVEPYRVVELSNDLRAAEAEESAEVHAILYAITRLLAEDLSAVNDLVEQLIGLDALHARASFADRHRCHAVEFDAEGRVELRQARHLLLGEECVPLDLVLPEGTRALVLSGANAGGKTVALKTLGTVTYLAASGYHVPVAEGGRTVFPRQVFCLIGDDQSLAHHLSSFSSHATSAAAILRDVKPGDLVLLDELMGGTDPEEGSALGVEYLLTLAKRGALTVVTTHYSVLKTLAAEEPRFENACVEFDEAAFEPTFRILIGSAGPSRGFEIAQRFGLPEMMVEKARLRLGPERARLEALLRGVESDRLETAVALKQAQDLRGELEEKQAELVQVRKDLQEKIYGEAKTRARELDEELTKLRRDVMEALQEGRTKDAARLVEATALHQEELPAPPEKEGWEGLSVGDRVRVAGFGIVGTIVRLEAGKKRATVDTGTMRCEADLTRCERVGAAEKSPGRAGPSATLSKKKRRAGETLMTTEVHLIGMRALEAREKLEHDLDQALANGADAVRVIHGYGTGALNRMVQEVLKEHYSVDEVRPGGEHEGGRGATIAVFS